jgi:hypothetical protein
LFALISPISCNSFEKGDQLAPHKFTSLGQKLRALQEDATKTATEGDVKTEAPAKVEIEVEERDEEDDKYGVFKGKRWVRTFDMKTQDDNCMLCLVDNE